MKIIKFFESFAKKHAEYVKQKQRIKKIYHKNDAPKKPWTFTKKLTAFLIVNCLAIEIYALITMWHFMDISALSALITAIVGECVASLAYVVKSTFENRVGGITYETAMKDVFHSIDEKDTDDAVG